MTFEKYANSRGWELVSETYDAPDDPDYEGPFEEWDGPWKVVTYWVMHKSVPINEGRQYAQMMDVPDFVRLADDTPVSHRRHWQAMIDLGEAALGRGVKQETAA